MTEEIGYHRRVAAAAAGIPIPAPKAPEPESRPAPPATPELDKQSAIIHTDAHKGLVAFLEWLDSEDSNGYGLVRYRQGHPHDVYGTQYKKVLATFYGLDLEKIDAEQEALLAYLREVNQQ